MSESYKRLFTHPSNVCAKEAPVLIAAGALLKDNETGELIVQLKFKNLVNKKIKALKVSLKAYDVDGKETDGVENVQYLDLDVGCGEEFGDSQPTVLPNKTARSFSARCTSVVFADGKSWSAPNDLEWKELPKQNKLRHELGNLAKQYKRETTNLSEFVPKEVDGFWLCACGNVIPEGDGKCCKCGMNKEAVFAMDKGALRARDAEYRENVGKKRAKITKIAIIAAAAVVLVIAAALTVTKVIIPLIEYNSAVDLMKKGSYDEAIAAFEAMDGYKDSDEKIDEIKAILAAEGNEAKYQEALALLEKNSYMEAAAIFDELGDYKDSSSLAKDAYYQAALMCLESGDNETAIAVLDYIGDYEDAVSLSRETKMKTIVSNNTLDTGLLYSVALKADGTVVAVGNNGNGQCDVSDWNDIVSISAGSYHTVGLKSDRTVVATGSNDFNQCDIEDWKDIVYLYTSPLATIGIKGDGTILTTDDEIDISDWSDIVALSNTGYHPGNYVMLGLKSDGTVVSTSGRDYGWTDIVAIDSSYRIAVGLKSDGTVVASTADASIYGALENAETVVAGWTDIVSVSVGNYHIVGLKSDGTVVAATYVRDTHYPDNGDFSECNVEDWTDIVAVSAGDSYTIGLKSDGTVVAVGNNENGQCDVSGWSNIMLPN